MEGFGTAVTFYLMEREKKSLSLSLSLLKINSWEHDSHLIHFHAYVAIRNMYSKLAFEPQKHEMRA